LFQWASIIKAHLMVLVLYKANSSSTSSYNQNIFSYRHDIDETLLT